MKQHSYSVFRGLIAALMIPLSATQAFSEEKTSPGPFPGLSALPADKEDISGKIYYDAAQAKVINKMIDQEEGVERLISTTLSKNSDTRYFVDFDPGPSADPMFVITDEKSNKVIGRVGADTLYIPNNGFVYTQGRSNNMHLEHRKYKIQDGELVEVKQPFSYVGLSSKAKVPLTLSSEKDGGETIANIPAGESLEVILREGDYLLIKTPFGLVGWWKMKTDVVAANAEIEGIYYAGD